jgi:phosphoglycolate phosphatase-like HAD superfamily hydrolase
MQGLVIFDVDGTLARTSQVDDDCWLQAAKDILGLDDMETDWGAYEHSTDEAIASQLIRDRTDFADNHETIERVRRRHDELTHAAVDADPSLFQATPGAEGVFDRLAEDGWASAIATGGWKGTATLKLVRAGIDIEGVPAAFAQDARPREDLIRLARDRAQATHGVAFERVVYVGDGAWDVRASALLGIGFVGIAEDTRRDWLIEQGAGIVLPDFSDHQAFLAAVMAD